MDRVGGGIYVLFVEVTFMAVFDFSGRGPTPPFGVDAVAWLAENPEASEATASAIMAGIGASGGGVAGSPDDFYGDAGVGSIPSGISGSGPAPQVTTVESVGLVNQPVAVTGQPLGSPAAATAVVAFSMIAAKFGSTMARNVFGVVRALGGGLQVQWMRLPGWVRNVVSVIGIAEGSDIIFRDDSGGGGGIMSGQGGPSAIDVMPGPGVYPGQIAAIGSWVANGVTFYRLNNGYIAVQNTKGRWKVWKPKRPIVLMPSGAGNLRTLLKADRVVHRQIGRLKKVINRRYPRAKK